MNIELIKEFIKKVELFCDFTDEEISLVAENIEIIKIDKDKLIFVENTPRKYMYLIYDGEVELFKTTPFGEEKRLSFFSKYDFLGEGSLVDDSPHSTSARALLETTVIKIDRDKLTELIKDKGLLAVKLYSRIARVISRRMKTTNTHSVNVGAQYESGRTRVEHDLIGERNVPEERYFGVQTLRAIENFNISGQNINTFPNIVRALAVVKMAAAKANYDIGLLSKPVANAIIEACSEIINGKFHNDFVVDMIRMLYYFFIC